MRVTNIDITNAIGCRRFAADLLAPVTLVAGANGAGKTSLIQSVRFALTGETPRISLKKDGHQLVSEGAKTGSIAVKWTDDDGEIGGATVTIPDCKLVSGKAGELHPAMRFVADMHRFAMIDANERRTFMFGLTGTTASAEKVRSMLVDRGCDGAKIETILPLLRSGFPAAHDEAKGKARDAKASWRTVTGEAYGEKKADGWKCDAPTIKKEELDAETSRLAALNGELEVALRAAGEINGREKAYQQSLGKVEGLREKAGRYARIQDKLNKDEAELKDWDAKVEIARGQASGAKAEHPLTCPHCSGLVVHRPNMIGAELQPYEAQENVAYPEADRQLREYEEARALMARSVENGRRDLQAADAAAKELRTLEEAGVAEAPDVAEVEEVNARLREARASHDQCAARVESMRDSQRASEAAQRKTDDAAKYHADVKAWDLIADALAPDGIPGELLAQALRPINHALAQAAADTGWRQATIDADMAIRAGGRPYVLLSESEQWRVDAMLTAAIANLSGLRMMLLDRLDVLDMVGRSDALGWLAMMADVGEIETCIVGATLKALPPGLPASVFGAFWMEDGEVQKAVEAEA